MFRDDPTFDEFLEEVQTYRTEHNKVIEDWAIAKDVGESTASNQYRNGAL